MLATQIGTFFTINKLPLLHAFITLTQHFIQKDSRSMAAGNYAGSFTSLCLVSALFTVFLWSPSSSLPWQSHPAARVSTRFIRSKCNSTDYPRLCIASLSAYAPTINNNPLHLIDAALNVSFHGAQNTSTMMARLSSGHMSSREAGAVSDCVEVLKSSVQYLRQSLKQMAEITRTKSRPKGMELMEKMNDVQTWVSTALTDESTCMDEYGGTEESQGVSPRHAKVRSVVRGRVARTTQLTSNALALISELVQPAEPASP